MSLGASTRGGAGPRCVGGAAGGAGRAPRGASRGWRGPSGAAARAERGGSEPAACLPAGEFVWKKWSVVQVFVV